MEFWGLDDRPSEAFLWVLNYAEVSQRCDKWFAHRQDFPTYP